MIARNYAVFRNGQLYTRTMTAGKARRMVLELRAQGFNASYAYLLEVNQ